MSDQFDTDDDYTEDLPAEPEAEGQQEGEPDDEPEQSEAGDEGEQESDSGYVETDDPKVKARLGQLTREKYEAKREADELKRRLEELERKQSESSAPKPVEAPTADLAIDDPDAYRKQLESHQAYLRNQAVHEHQQKQLEQQKQAAKQQQMQQAAQAYNKRVQELKIDPAELQQAGQFVANAGLNNDVMQYLLEHDKGPAIVAELGKDPEALYSLRDLPAHRATVEIERRFGGLNPTPKRKSSAPPPPTKVSGSRPAGKSTPDGWTIE
ncbi:hypothetical protein [Gilvimarinus chinensis]|uniref:hypothetical protein n=1 Tax=Gilvimarinus chinensis TaxID=396005 RepID=UPI0003817FAD|nr:hypothetical protein [Gilvimarinus chinensis]